MTIEELVELFDEHCRDDEWREVLRLICGQIDERFVGRIVEHLATRTDLKKWDSHKKTLSELPLAIWCLTEVRSTGRVEGAVSKLADSLLQIYIPGKGSRDFHEELLAAIRETQSPWPGGETIRSTAIARIGDVKEGNWAARYLPMFVVYAAAQRETQMPFLQSTIYGLRCGALQALAEKWPDETTRNLLAERAVQDENDNTRSAALQALAEKWPDETTRNLLAERARVDGVAASFSGGRHSEFGRIVFTSHLYGSAPYLDPARPISREHIEQAAKQAKISTEEIDETVRSLSAHLGWDITKGAAE